MMQRYFVNNEDIKKDVVMMDDASFFHIKQVMRMQVGDCVTCVDEDGHTYLCEVQTLSKPELRIVKLLEEDHELDVHVRLIYGMPKMDKFELVLQKCTELGVSEVVPLVSRKVVVKLDENRFEKKRARFEKIMKEASEQSQRSRQVVLHSPKTISQLDLFKADYCLVAYEEKSREGEAKMFSQVLNKLQKDQWLNIVVGCEGGFVDEEIQQLEKMGYQACSLGKRILRSETAPIFMMSAISFSRELGGI